MKKIIIRVTLGVLCLILIGVAVLFYYINSMRESDQEAIQYNQSKVVQMIDAQLNDVDIDSIREKKSLIVEKSIVDLRKLIVNESLSYVDLTAFYLDRIRQIDQTESGTNSIVEVNPNAIQEAKVLDSQKTQSNSILHGMPITLKDNINAVGMPMSAGTYILKDYIPKEDAPLVKQLKNEGAIILAKTNLSELANFTSPKTPSGYSSKSGQTRNPFGPLKMSPLGSSSGSAVSITENIGVLSIGTETTGSIIAPSFINSVVGMKPTRSYGLTSGIFPLSSSLDVPGPIAKYVEDVAIAYNGMSAESAGKVDLSSLDTEGLRGKNIGVIKNNNEKNDELIEKLQQLGANTIEIEIDSQNINNFEIILNDFKFDVSDFARRYKLPFDTLSDLIAFNRKDLKRRARYGQIYLEEANDITQRDMEKSKMQIAEAKKILKNAIVDNKLDALVFFDGDEVSIPAVAGYPVITVPFGLTNDNQPLGVSFIGDELKDVDLIKIAFSFEQGTKLRQILP